jgi:hypothetical protein
MEPYEDWRLETIGGIKHKLISQGGSFGEEDADWTMVIVIRAIDLVNFTLEVFPQPTFSLGGYVYPRRFYPAGLPALKATRLQVEGFTSGRPIDPFSIDSGAPAKTYEPYLRATISFSTCAENDEPDPTDPFTYLEIGATGSGEYLTSKVDLDKIKWRDSGGTDEDPDENDKTLEQKITSTEVEWSVKWNQIPYAWFYSTILPRIRSMEGQVNNADMTVLHDAPKETVLFLTWSLDQQFTWRDGYAGASPVTLSLKFIEKNFQGFSGESSGHKVQVTHNHLWRPNVGWRRLLVNGEPLYEQADLNSIFVP